MSPLRGIRGSLSHNWPSTKEPSLSLQSDDKSFLYSPALVLHSENGRICTMRIKELRKLTQLQWGAIDLSSTCTHKGPVAQRLEQGTHNPLVGGSNPSGPTSSKFLMQRKSPAPSVEGGGVFRCRNLEAWRCAVVRLGQHQRGGKQKEASSGDDAEDASGAARRWLSLHVGLPFPRQRGLFLWSKYVLGNTVSRSPKDVVSAG
jgi:hypothetical protein